jgi:hypothetical protein
MAAFVLKGHSQMSFPDYAILCRGSDVPPRIDGFPHRLALLPVGLGMDDLGGVGCRPSGAFLIEPDCAHEALSDPAFDTYLRAKVPVLVYGRRARDLRPMLRRTEAFRARSYAVEVLQ